MAMKVLVVDDSGVMRKIVIKTLKESKFGDSSTLEAANGADALVTYKKEKLDLVLCDWNMPTMSGIDFVKEARKVKTDKHIPIIMVTTEGTMERLEQALNEGVDRYIVKPFTAADLENAISLCIK